MLFIMKHDPYSHPFINNFNHSLLQRLCIDYTEGMTRDISIFANLKQLEIYTEDQLNLKEWEIPSKLRYFQVSTAGNPWNPVDDDAMKDIIDNYSLTEICVLSHSYDFNEMILNSPNTSIQIVCLTQFSIMFNGEMGLGIPFIERDLITRLLLRFKNVHTISVPVGYAKDPELRDRTIEYFEMLKEVFLEVEQIQRRRSFNFVSIFN